MTTPLDCFDFMLDAYMYTNNALNMSLHVMMLSYYYTYCTYTIFNITMLHTSACYISFCSRQFFYTLFTLLKQIQTFANSSLLHNMFFVTLTHIYTHFKYIYTIKYTLFIFFFILYQNMFLVLHFYIFYAPEGIPARTP